MWEEAGRDLSAYIALIHRKAMELRDHGRKLKYVR